MVVKKVISICLVILGVISSTISIGQVADSFVNTNLDNSTWDVFKNETELSNKVFYYLQPDSLQGFLIKVDNDSLYLEEVITNNFKRIGYNVTYDGSGAYFITKGTSIKMQLPFGFFVRSSDVVSVKKKLGLSDNNESKLVTSSVYVPKTIIVGDRKLNPEHNKSSLSGYVIGSSDGYPIIGGTIYVDELETGTSTDENGYFELLLDPGKYSLVFKSIESIQRIVKIDIGSSGRIDIKLDKNLYLLQEVEISSAQADNVRGTQMGLDKISAKTIEDIPVVLGEKDIVKVALLLPGVTSVGEGSSGFNVRGSPVDQNLFYIENIPVYNTSHLFGFFSAFNPDIIDNFMLYKGSIPAQYGGRLSSIFDISTSSGSMEKFKACGGISPITLRLKAEGPIVKNKLSFIAGVRTTYSDWVLKFVKDPEIRNSKAYFGDLVLGLDANVNEKNKLKFFSYYSEDRIKLSNSTSYQFNNTGASLSWLHAFRKKNDLKISFVYSDYNFQEENTELSIASFKKNYSLNHNQLNIDVGLRPFEKHSIRIGGNGVLYLLDRGEYLPLNNESSVSPVEFGNEKAIETALYISDEWKLSPLLTILGGLRYNYYSYLGANSVYTYLPNSPMSASTIIDTLNFGNNKPIKSYGGLDYRLSVNYLLNTNMSVKASYNRLHQYIFMLTNTIALSPSDTWKLADYNIKPMVGDQFSLGVYASFGKTLEGSVEGYYKKVHNLVEYKDGADILTSKVVEWDVLQGDLDAYGIEFMIRKPFGKLNGWVNYSYSNSSVLVNNGITGENINFGKRYPSNFDHPHTFNLVANFKASRRLVLSGNLIYSTGRPITYPAAIYYLDGQEIFHYSNRNEYRIPDYFRIDIAVKVEGNLLSKKLAHGQFIFSVYNLTGRKNAYSVYFKGEEGKVVGYKMSIFGTQIFSLTYDFKLGNYDD